VPIPTVRATIVAPEPLLNERSFLRLHNRCAKEALRDEGLHHWKDRIPRHFTRSAHQHYGYAPRSPAYMRFKARRYHSATDLVKTSQTKDEMTKTPPVIRAGGKASDDAGHAGQLRLTLVFPFHPGQKAHEHYRNLASKYGRLAVRAAKKRAAKRTGVTIDQMRKEIATILPEEARDTARRFLRGYGRRLSTGLAKAPRIRKRVSAATSGKA
jgi:hypothetical protein